jgi:hypothetical protein
VVSCIFLEDKEVGGKYFALQLIVVNSAVMGKMQNQTELQMYVITLVK